MVTKESNPEKRVCAQKEEGEHKNKKHAKRPFGPMPQSPAFPPTPRMSNLLIPGVEALLTKCFFARKFTIAMGTTGHVIGVGITTPGK
jgi:hypothetical protein